MRRLVSSLEIDPGPLLRELQWAAQVCIETAIDDMVQWYRSDGST
jgi:dTDP-D-glucose 4,6-dehydratase